jgi:hypothetical protein
VVLRRWKIANTVWEISVSETDTYIGADTYFQQNGGRGTDTYIVVTLTDTYHLGGGVAIIGHAHGTPTPS